MTIHGIGCEPLTKEQQAKVREVLNQPDDAALGSKRRGGIIPPPASRASVGELRAEVERLHELLFLTMGRLQATMETVRDLTVRLENLTRETVGYRWAATERHKEIQRAYDHDGKRSSG